MVTTAAEEKVYRIAPQIMRGRFLYMSAALWFVPVFMLIVGEPVDGLLFGLFGVIWMIAGAIFVWAGRTSGLYVSPQGISYRAPGMTISTTWANVERIDKQIIYGDGEVEGLALREPGWQPNALIGGATAIMKFSPGHFFQARSIELYKTFIPLSSLQTKHWRNAEIGAQIRRYVPHLFE
ncbi:MAG: hypothetical protein J0M07_20695 [Anaerolineae bacterium]|nr:hypothetical protein [Anaerolineae bacterium]